MIGILLFFTQLIFAKEVILERYCFDSMADAHSSQSIINQILIKEIDRIEADEACLNIFIEEKRSEILERWIKTRINRPYKKDFATVAEETRHCEIEMKIIKNNRAQEASVKISNQPDLSKTQTNNQTVQKLSLIGLSGKPIIVTFGQKKYDLFCQLQGDKKANIHLQSTLTPINPLLASTQPINQSELLVSSTLLLNKGEEMTLTSLIKEIEDKSKKLSIERGWEWKETSENDTAEVTILLK